MAHLPDHWIQKLCAALSVQGWRDGVFPHQVVRLFTAWQKAEGGTATFNPLNTTNHVKDAFGAWQGADYNKIGVCNYQSSFYGISATAATLLAGDYDSLVDALRTADATGVTAETLVENHRAELKTWGTNPDTILAVLASVS